MPQVFSPGEAETRPLDPDEIVYTTAQKVADLLEIGPQEATAVSADSETTGVFITGAEYRNTGYTVGDTILMYSDADPLGQERTINGITSTINGVRLGFADAIVNANFEVVDNTNVQNQASFTNGSNRGMARSKVEQLIKRGQDKIDNMTHNSWRPNLVTAEYINFDTYKPYRRRYYTDYVGTTPLLFRNIQQMLRIELWQGADYREIGAAEARLNIVDYADLAGSSVYLSPGNGYYGALTVGSGTNQWRGEFDKVTSAQSLADLINKEDRVSKIAIPFTNGSAGFTLPGSTSDVAVHNEFLATANSDYGTGKVKLTSMRDTVAGETCSVAVNNDAIEISQSQTKTALSVSVNSTTVTVDTTDGFAEGGVLMIGTDEVLFYTGKTSTTFTGCANLSGTPLTTLATADVTVTQHLLSIDLQGGSASGDKGRLRDWWIDPEMGVVYFNNSYPFFEWNAVKVSYIYGERYLEKAIEDVCTKMVAIDILLSDDRSVLIPEGTQNVDLTSKIQLYKQDIEKILPRYVEVVAFE